PVVRGALRASAEVGGAVDTWRRAPLQVLARLHVLAATDLAEPDTLGRPAGGAEIARRLDQIATLVTTDSAGPAVVLAAVVHGELLSLSAFGTADGIVARAASRLCLIGRGLDPKAVSVPEVGHLELASEYAEGLAGYRSGEPAGVAAWLRHCCAAVSLGAREGLAVCAAVERG
ncbi:MAG: oxidoreductase, partial [Mycobacteriales bacterium]